jgi:hypothetical protein
MGTGGRVSASFNDGTGSLCEFLLYLVQGLPQFLVPLFKFVHPADEPVAVQLAVSSPLTLLKAVRRSPRLAVGFQNIKRQPMRVSDPSVRGTAVHDVTLG